MATKNEATRADVTALLKARNALLWIVTREEVRVERAVVEAAAAANYETQTWDCDRGLCDAGGKQLDSVQDPKGALDVIRAARARRVYVLRDYHKWLADPFCLRGLKSLARELQGTPRDEARAVVVLTPSSEIPPELTEHATVIEWPLPERTEIGAILDEAVAALPDKLRDELRAELKNGVRDAAIDAAVGLNGAEASSCYAKSLVTLRRIDPKQVASEKKRVIARERVLTWHDPDPRGLDAVGGLDLLKAWLQQRKCALSQRARDFGLPAPRGCLLVGISGCGKSLTAKAVAAAWGLPLLRLDLGALRSKWVGESEANIRKALQVAEAVSPCVLWLDEVEKALAGAMGPSGDSGIAADALGAVLSWMQERTGTVFVIATANDVSKLPPELLRKGRFDELFFVDLPTAAERESILAATLRHYDRDPESIDLRQVAVSTASFTGAEIAAIVPDALFAAFADGERAIETADLVRATDGVAPLAKTAAERIEALRAWAKGRCRFASAPESSARGSARTIDL